MAKTSSKAPDPRDDPAFVARRTRALRIKEEEKRETVFLVIAEVLFVLLPFFTIGLLFYFKGKFHEMATQPEWALAASVISGQAIVKCISGFLSMPSGRSPWQKISLWITGAIFFSLTPSLLILTLILTGEGSQAPTALLRAQIVVFFVGLLIFTFFTWLLEILRAEAKFEHDAGSPRMGDTTRGPFRDNASMPSRQDSNGGNNHYEKQEDWNSMIDERAKTASLKPS